MLPLVLKVLTDTSGAKLTPVTREMDGLRLSSQKTGYAIRNLVNILSDSKDPVVALATSVDGLTRAFRLGVGATIAVTAISQAIKVFIGNAEKMNGITESLNNTIANFQANAGGLNFEGSISQVKNLSDAIAKARAEMPATGAGGFFDNILGGAGKSIAGTMLAREQLTFSIQQAETAKKQAQYSMETAIAKENELEALRLINPEQAKQLEIINQYNKKVEDLRRQGLLTPAIQAGIEQRRDIALQGAMGPQEQKAREQRIKNYQAALAGGSAPAATGERGIAAVATPQVSMFAPLTDEVRAIKAQVVRMFDLMDRRLGVPILRSAS